MDNVSKYCPAELQYLDWSDLNRYLQTLQANRDHLINDASYLRILYQQHLLPSKGESKKEAGCVALFETRMKY